MGSYEVCGLIVRADLSLPELARSASSKPDMVIHLQPAGHQPPVDCAWFHEWRLHNDEPWLKFARQGSDYLLRFPSLVDFVVSGDATQIQCYPAPDTPLDTLRHLLLDQVLPLILSKRGMLVMHASAVAAPEGALAFLGETGKGKSTIAASFCQQGFPFLTDDCLLLTEEQERPLVAPSYPGLRLWPKSLSTLFGRQPSLPAVAHYTAKKRLVAAGDIRFCSKRVPLRRMYLLDPGETPSVSVSLVTPREALIEMVECSFLLDVKDRQALRSQFERLARLAVLPLFYRLSFPRDFSSLPAVHRTVLEQLSEAGS